MSCVHIIIGHRGTGKTKWLRAISQKSKKNFKYFDLDEEIEKFFKKSISDIFHEGEKAFRDIERDIFF